MGRLSGWVSMRRYGHFSRQKSKQAFATPPHPVFQGIPSGTPFYFVHSYYCHAADPAIIAGTTEYGGLEFTSAAATGSLVATQFHPERSGDAGMQLLKNFLATEA